MSGEKKKVTFNDIVTEIEIKPKTKVIKYNKIPEGISDGLLSLRKSVKDTIFRNINDEKLKEKLLTELTEKKSSNSNDVKSFLMNNESRSIKEFLLRLMLIDEEDEKKLKKLSQEDEVFASDKMINKVNAILNSMILNVLEKKTNPDEKEYPIFSSMEEKKEGGTNLLSGIYEALKSKMKSVSDVEIKEGENSEENSGLQALVHYMFVHENRKREHDLVNYLNHQNNIYPELKVESFVKGTLSEEEVGAGKTDEELDEELRSWLKNTPNEDEIINDSRSREISVSKNVGKTNQKKEEVIREEWKEKIASFEEKNKSWISEIEKNKLGSNGLDRDSYKYRSIPEEISDGLLPLRNIVKKIILNNIKDEKFKEELEKFKQKKSGDVKSFLMNDKKSNDVEESLLRFILVDEEKLKGLKELPQEGEVPRLVEVANDVNAMLNAMILNALEKGVDPEKSPFPLIGKELLVGTNKDLGIYEDLRLKTQEISNFLITPSEAFKLKMQKISPASSTEATKEDIKTTGLESLAHYFKIHYEKGKYGDVFDDYLKEQNEKYHKFLLQNPTDAGRVRLYDAIYGEDEGGENNYVEDDSARGILNDLYKFYGELSQYEKKNKEKKFENLDESESLIIPAVKDICDKLKNKDKDGKFINMYEKRGFLLKQDDLNEGKFYFVFKDKATFIENTANAEMMLSINDVITRVIDPELKKDPPSLDKNLLNWMGVISKASKEGSIFEYFTQSLGYKAVGLFLAVVLSLIFIPIFFRSMWNHEHRDEFLSKEMEVLETLPTSKSSAVDTSGKGGISVDDTLPPLSVRDLVVHNKGGEKKKVGESLEETTPSSDSNSPPTLTSGSPTLRKGGENKSGT